jgi:hypothetical protein
MNSPAEHTVASTFGWMTLIGFVALYLWCVLAKWSERRQLAQEGRLIPWQEALRLATDGRGWMIATFSGSRVHELWYVDGDPPPDDISIFDLVDTNFRLMDTTALFVDRLPRRRRLDPTLAALRAQRRCIDHRADRLVNYGWVEDDDPGETA